MSPAILTAMVHLSECVNESQVLGEAVLDAVDGGNPPAWVWAYRAQVRRIQAAAEALETLLTGYRGCAPDGDTPDACPIDLRGQSSALPGTDSCLEKQSSLASE